MVKEKISGWIGSFRDSVDRVEQETTAYREASPKGHIDLQIFGVVILASVILSIQDYYGSSSHWNTLEPLFSLFMDDAKGFLSGIFTKGKYARLYRLWYWSGITVLTYMFLPFIWIKLVMRKRIRDYGFSVRGIMKHSWIYVSMFLIVLPALFVVGHTESFQRTYPFYKEAGRSLFDFFGWEIAYVLQFLSLEFFFRGFLVHAFKQRFGYYSVLLAVMPYCMIHFGKPMPETLGAIFAGIALGTLSLFTRSIWLGVAIHVSVAVSMDLISLWLAGKLF